MAVVSRSLSGRMDTVEKYRDLANTLRQRAGLPTLAAQRTQMLALADHFDRLADEVLTQQVAMGSASRLPWPNFTPRHH